MYNTTTKDEDIWNNNLYLFSNIRYTTVFYIFNLRIGVYIGVLMFLLYNKSFSQNNTHFSIKIQYN